MRHSSRPFRCLLLALAWGLSCSFLFAQQEPVHHVSGYIPAQGPHRELSADRPPRAGAPIAASVVRNASSPTPWRLLATIPGATVHDISFVTPMVGYAASENGQVWKTTDGGATWTEVLNLLFPYEWYGVHAFDANNVLISGFSDSSINNGIIRWSHDGGVTWTGDIPVSTTAWSFRPRFADDSVGIVADQSSTAHTTPSGGANAADWATVMPVNDGSWFGNQFTLLPDKHAWLSGIHFCSSTDAGATWTCGHSIDSVFDGEVFFADDNHGWVAAGEIAPNVEGWLHRTTDGGKTWSDRVLNTPWPIREIRFVSNAIGWAAGGNFSVGGIYFSSDGGQTWSPDTDSGGHEMDACDAQPVGDAYQVWCAGFGLSDSAVYTVTGAATPQMSPAPQSFTTTDTVTLSTTTPNATIYYTADGSIPITSSTLYTAPVTVSKTTTLQAVAIAPGLSPSIAAVGTYSFAPVTPELQLTGGAPVSVSAGVAATVNLFISATSSVSGVAFSCSGLPSGAKCSFSPSSLAAATQPVQVPLTISTSNSAAVDKRSSDPLWLAMALPLLWGLRRKRRPGLLLVIAGAAIAIGGAIAGCGGSSGNHIINPVHATVTATAAAPGATSATTQIQLTINP